jgi:hypothetical protein
LIAKVLTCFKLNIKDVNKIHTMDHKKCSYEYCVFSKKIKINCIIRTTCFVIIYAMELYNVFHNEKILLPVLVGTKYHS